MSLYRAVRLVRMPNACDNTCPSDRRCPWWGLFWVCSRPSRPSSRTLRPSLGSIRPKVPVQARSSPRRRGLLDRYSPPCGPGDPSPAGHIRAGQGRGRRWYRPSRPLSTAATSWLSSGMMHLWGGSRPRSTEKTNHWLSIVLTTWKTSCRYRVMFLSCR